MLTRSVQPMGGTPYVSLTVDILSFRRSGPHIELFKPSTLTRNCFSPSHDVALHELSTFVLFRFCIRQCSHLNSTSLLLPSRKSPISYIFRISQQNTHFSIQTIVSFQFRSLPHAPKVYDSNFTIYFNCVIVDTLSFHAPRSTIAASLFTSTVSLLTSFLSIVQVLSLNY